MPHEVLPPQDMRPFHQRLVDMLMMRGQPQDITLESEGTVDPQLPAPPLDQLNKAFQNSQKTALGSDPALTGLRRFGQ